jgi:chromatin segregation and condensation protein Rec8/ScpA/Scc1 (kleisin family)
MTESKTLLEELQKKVKKIHHDVLEGKISLLEYQLVPIFNKLKDSLNVSNINESSKTYIEACDLLDKKFEELKALLNSLEEEQKFKDYIKSKPEDSEILALFNGCWLKTFNLEPLSYTFLESSKERIVFDKTTTFSIQHLQKEETNEDFILKLPKHKFTEKMLNFYEKIKKKLPCKFNEVFEDMDNQIQIYNNFIYLLHLIQLKKIKYQSETDTLYIVG